jgi:hypothetical protein
VSGASFMIVMASSARIHAFSAPPRPGCQGTEAVLSSSRMIADDLQEGNSFAVGAAAEDEKQAGATIFDTSRKRHKPIWNFNVASLYLPRNYKRVCRVLAWQQDDTCRRHSWPYLVDVLFR